MKKSVMKWALSLVVATAVALPALGAAPGGAAGGAPGAAGGGAGGGGRGGRGGGGAGGAGGAGGRTAMDPTAMIQSRLTTIRAQMGVTDDAEWKVISDKLQKVLDLEQKLAAVPNPLSGGRGGAGGPGGAGGGRGGRGGGGGGPTPTATVDPANPLSVAMGALNVTVADPAAKTDDLKPKVTAVRDAHKKLESDLKAAQADLLMYCSVRQEAVLVSNGILD